MLSDKMGGYQVIPTPTPTPTPTDPLINPQTLILQTMNLSETTINSTGDLKRLSCLVYIKYCQCLYRKGYMLREVEEHFPTFQVCKYKKCSFNCEFCKQSKYCSKCKNENYKITNNECVLKNKIQTNRDENSSLSGVFARSSENKQIKYSKQLLSPPKIKFCKLQVKRKCLECEDPYYLTNGLCRRCSSNASPKLIKRIRSS